MNRRAYRIVFNAARGQLMAVAETACSHVAGASGQTQAGSRHVPFYSDFGASPSILRPLIVAISAAFFLGAAHAQIIADPSAPATQRPTVLMDSVGRPLINIQTPSGAGVSRNTYRQFDVQSNGVVLNNSRASNPWLATGEARVILNEVNSSNPSFLRGQVAVNGVNAQIVIANPSGLRIDGASFVNASRVTLTTGTPVVTGGGLSQLRVERGSVDVTGRGLDVSGIPYTEILSRTATLAAQTRASAAGEINVTTGAQTVDYATGQLSAVGTAGPGTGFAIDASALGSMYAGRITLLATDAGVGVRNAGEITAALQLVLTADGQLINSGTLSAPFVSLGTVSGDITPGQAQATNALLISSGADVNVSGRGLEQAAGSTVLIGAQKRISLLRDTNARISSTAKGGRVALNARESISLGSKSSVEADADLTLSSDGSLTAEGASLKSNAAMSAIAGSSMALNGVSASASSIQLETGKPFEDSNSPITLSGTNLQSTGAITVISTGDLNTSNNTLTAAGHLHLGSSRKTTLTNDSLQAGSVDVIGSGISTTDLKASARTGSINISSSAGDVSLLNSIDTVSMEAAKDIRITALGGNLNMLGIKATADNIIGNSTGNTGIGNRIGGKWTPAVTSSLNSRKSVLLATVGADKQLAVNSKINAGAEGVSLISAGGMNLGGAQISASGSISAASNRGIEAFYPAFKAGQDINIESLQGDVKFVGTGLLDSGNDTSLIARAGALNVDGAGASSTSRVGRDTHLIGASVDLKSVQFSSGRDLNITASNGSLGISAVEVTRTEGGYNNKYMQESVLTAGRNLQLLSASDFNGKGLRASAGADLRLQSLANLNLVGTSNEISRVDGIWTISERTVNVSQLNAGGAMSLSAGSDLLLNAVNANASGSLSINALGNVTLDALQSWRRSTGRSETTSGGKWAKTTTVTHHLRESTTTNPTALTGRNVSVSAGNNLNTYGTRISAFDINALFIGPMFGPPWLSRATQNFSGAGRIDLKAGGAANYYAIVDQSIARDDSSSNSSFLGIGYSSSSGSSTTLGNTPRVTSMQTQAQLTSQSGGNTLFQGTQVSATGGSTIQAGVGENAKADARIILEGVKTTVQESRTYKSDAVVWQRMSGSGGTTETMALPTFAGGGTFSAPGGLVVQIPEGNFKSQIETLSKQPGMDYLNALSARTDVNWQPVKLAYDKWEYSQEGLTPAGAALLSVAVAWATGGTMGAELLGTTTKLTSAMANAAFNSLAAQASITLVNNKGDIGKTLKDMANSSTVKATLAAALTAGALEKLGATSTMTELSKSTGFSDKLTYNLINATGRAITNTAITGGNLEDALKQSLTGALVDTAHGRAASHIKGLESEYLAHKLAHALAGCVAGAASGGACKDGAVGAAIGEVIAGPGGLIKPKNGMFYTEDEKRNVLAITKLVGGAVSAYAGGDAQTAMNTAEVAVTNNAFFVPPLVYLLAAAAGAYTTGVGKGDPVEGLKAIGGGNDPLSKALADGTQAAVSLSMSNYPAQTRAALNLLAAAGQQVDATLTYLDDKSGRVVSTQWNSLSPDTRAMLIGAGKVTGLVFSPVGVGQVKSIVANAPKAVSERAIAIRPTPRQSEIDVGADLPRGARPQVSFKNGEEVDYGTPGSVRPDYCLGNVCSVEVKNFNIATNSNGLVRNVSQQAIDRAAHLPPGMTQTIVIDIRGQTVATQQLDLIRLQIVQRSNGAVSPTNIRFKDK